MTTSSAQDSQGRPERFFSESTFTAEVPGVRLARRLSLFALCLFVLYGLLALRGTLPVRLINPAWQLAISNALVDNAAIALVGLALLYLAAYLNPDDDKLARRLRLVARLAIAASLGFLLLLPVRGFATWTLYNTSRNAQSRQASQAAVRLDRFRDQVSQATSTDDLQRRLAAIEAPPLPPALASQPLDQIKRQLNTSLQQGEAALARTRQGPSGEVLSASLLDTIRSMLVSLVYAVAFAAAGQRPRSSLTFLDEIRQLGPRRRGAGRSQLGRAGTQSAMADYIDKLSGSDDPDDQAPPGGHP